MGRISSLDAIPELRDFIADCWVAGKTNQQIADAVTEVWPALTPGKRTIQEWRHDDEVALRVSRATRDRIARVLRKTDAVIWDALEKRADQMDVQELLAIRKAFAPEVDARTDEKTDKAGIVNELFGRAADDPEFAKRLADAVKRSDDAR